MILEMFSNLNDSVIQLWSPGQTVRVRDVIQRRDKATAVSFDEAEFPLARAIWVFKGMFLPSSSSSAPAAIIVGSLSPSTPQQPFCWQFGKPYSES